MCSIPTVVIVAGLYICILSSVAIISISFGDNHIVKEVAANFTVPEALVINEQTRLDSAPLVFLLVMGFLLLLLFLINFLTLANACSTLLFPSRRKHRLQKAANRLNNTKDNVYLQEVRKEVQQISSLVSRINLHKACCY